MALPTGGSRWLAVVRRRVLPGKWGRCDFAKTAETVFTQE